MTAAEEEKIPSIRFDVMPNTGHHYMFVPLTNAWLKKYDTSDQKIKRVCIRNAQPWRQYEEQGHSGARGKVYSWIRYRHGVDAKGTPGVWLAVETNLGTIKRGIVVEKKDVGEGEVPKSEDERTRSPYAFSDISRLVSRPDSSKDSVDVLLTIPNPQRGQKPIKIAVIEVIWQDKYTSPTDVDLIVDFGNTRTVVLALENNRQATGDKLYSVCMPVPFISRGHEYPGRDKIFEDPNAKLIADSWILLQEPLFLEHDVDLNDGKPPYSPSCEYNVTEKVVDPGGIFTKPKKVCEYSVTKRIPQMFVEIAPVIMGGEAGELLSTINLTSGENLSMSSPKRYLWDSAPCKGASGDGSGINPWSMNPNRWSGKGRRDRPSSLRGLIRRYIYSDSTKDWDIEHPPFEDEVVANRPTDPPGEKAEYPRRTAMMWAALYVLESAYRQITSFNWRAGNNNFAARRLKSVNVTFPSGWIAAERAAYRKAWEQAINIFTLAHFDTRKDVSDKDAEDARPRLYLELDEAVASQLPFIHSEVRRLEGANAWIALYGRPHGKKSHRVRVMTIDIGGGTMDTSIVEYRNCASGSQISLKYNVLFRDCNSFAGDSVMLSIIQRVLLPAMLRERGIEDADDEVAECFSRILHMQRRDLKDRAKWQRITKMLFIPIVRRWLTDVVCCPGGHYKDEENEFRMVGDMADESAIAEFNEYLKTGGLDANFLDPQSRLAYRTEEINECIGESLDNGITPLGKFVAAYDVDVVTLSGKISEMPKVVEMLRDRLPICAQRIIPMKDYMAGDWYPMSNDGKISDAKTVTAVGAALFVAGRNGLIADWRLSKDELAGEAVSSGGNGDGNMIAMRNYWGIPKKGKNGVAYGFSDAPILTRDEDTNEDHIIEDTDLHGVSIMPNQYIGRAKYNTRDTCVEQQYFLRWVGRTPDGNARPSPTHPLAIVFARTSDEGDDGIEIKSVCSTMPEVDGDVTEKDVVLELNTLKGEGFWMDECRFEVEMNVE